MKVYKRGSGESEVTVVGSLHGDEPTGRRAIEKFLEEEHEFTDAVKFIVANEEALKQDVRYIDTDLNRSFPGDPDSDLHEERLAAKMMDEIDTGKVLDLHTTHSYPLPFATFTNLNDITRSMMRGTGVTQAVHFPEHNGTLNEHFDGVIVETGFQKTEMALHNAVGVITNFLASEGVLDVSYSESDPEIYSHRETIEGDWEFTARNFSLVEKGEVYARKDGEELVAQEDFYPVLMSTEGYSGMLGFRAQIEEKHR